MTIATLTPVLAEIWLALCGLVLLMIGVFRGDKSTRLIIALTVAAFAVALLLIVGPAAQQAGFLGGKIAARVVDAAIVPDHQGVRGPAMGVDEFGPFAMIEQKFQQLIAFRGIKPDDVARHQPADIERPAAGVGVNPH